MDNGDGTYDVRYTATIAGTYFIRITRNGQLIATLNDAGVEFSTFDILGYEEVRQGLKAFSDWPTYPQLYANGELLGGCDIVLEMAKSGELKEAVTAA